MVSAITFGIFLNAKKLYIRKASCNHDGHILKQKYLKAHMAFDFCYYLKNVSKRDEKK